MNINRAGKQNKAFWRLELKMSRRWEKEHDFQISQHMIQAMAHGWIAGVNWKSRQPARRPKTKKKVKSV